MCSYMAMFPPSVPHVFIRWLTKPGETVYDPFCGRGTTVLEACLLNRVGIGSDANPLAWLLTSAKAEIPSMSAVKSRLAQLRREREICDTADEPAEIRAVFAPDVLGQLLWLRDALNSNSSIDRFLSAVLLGILHANARKDGTPRGLSVSMPNTFSMSPGYVVRFMHRHQLKPPSVDVLDRLTARVEYLYQQSSVTRQGYAWLQDISKPISLPESIAHPKLIFTSPPYLGVMKYGKLNWLRLWFLKQLPKAVDETLFASSSLDKYVGFMSTAIRQLRTVLREDGYICLVIGDVRRPKEDLNLAAAVAERCLNGSDLRLQAVIEDQLPVKHKVSRIWKEKKGQATKTDRILILGGPRAAQLPTLPSIEWTKSMEAAA